MFKKNSGSKKLMDEKGEGDYLNFPSKKICLTVPKHFVEEPLCAVFQIISGGEKFYGRERGGEITKLSVEIFCLKVPKHFVGEAFSLSLVPGIGRLYASEGYVTIFRRKFFFSQYGNIS